MPETMKIGGKIWVKQSHFNVMKLNDEMWIELPDIDPDVIDYGPGCFCPLIKDACLGLSCGWYSNVCHK